MKTNYSVVLPIADKIMGTFVARSPIHFNQVHGHAVPDVQPEGS